MAASYTNTAAGKALALAAAGGDVTCLFFDGPVIWITQPVAPQPQSGTGITSDVLSSAGGAAQVGYQIASGFQPRTVEAKLRETPSMLDAGGLADYSGSPLYDGNDASRVTGTDNTTAFQILVNKALAAGKSTVRIPAGQWAIKTGNLSFSNFDRLSIVGDGIGVTVLDFVREDVSRSSYVDNDGANAAHCIAKFDTGNYLEFRDLTIKATTKNGFVNGQSGPSNSATAYYGAVWGFKAKNVKEVVCNRVRIERFNYRGLSVYGSATASVTLNQCEGFSNTSTGYWIQDASILRINGGEFSYNGILGDMSTGYGVTASSNVGRVISIGAHYFRNYRKGLDTHGCGGMLAIGNVFEDNLVYHLAAPNWSVPAGVTDAVFKIKDNTFSSGENADSIAWLTAAYAAIVAAGYTTQAVYLGGIVRIADVSSNGTRQNKIKRIEFHGNTITSHYYAYALAPSFNGSDGSSAIELWVRDDGVVSFKGNRINFEGVKVPASGTIYVAVPILVPFGSLLSFDGDEIIWPEDTGFSNTSYSAVTPASITYSSGVATVTLPDGHGWQDGEIVQIAGAVQAQFNGEKLTTRVSANVYTYACSDPGVSSATGTITASVRDRGLLICTNGINTRMRGCSIRVNNSRIVGGTGLGKRSEAVFDGKTRHFGNNEFAFSLSPFKSATDPYFLGRQTQGVFESDGNTYKSAAGAAFQKIASNAS